MPRRRFTLSTPFTSTKAWPARRKSTWKSSCRPKTPKREFRRGWRDGSRSGKGSRSVVGRKKQVEIDSDKYTTLGVCALLLFSLWEVVAHARDLLWLTYHPQPRTWPNYMISIFIGY